VFSALDDLELSDGEICRTQQLSNSPRTLREKSFGIALSLKNIPLSVQYSRRARQSSIVKLSESDPFSHQDLAESRTIVMIFVVVFSIIHAVVLVCWLQSIASSPSLFREAVSLRSPIKDVNSNADIASFTQGKLLRR
jgi:hypothetical protein